MMLADPLRTEHLLLYRPTVHDLAPVYAMYAESRSLEEVRNKVADWIAHWDRYAFGYWIARNDAEEFIGVGGIARVERDPGGRVDLYYAIAPRARHRGLATEIARAALDLAFGTLDLASVRATIAVGDAHAIAVARAAGMRPVGDTDVGGQQTFVAERPTR